MEVMDASAAWKDLRRVVRRVEVMAEEPARTNIVDNFGRAEVELAKPGISLQFPLGGRILT